MKRVIIVHGWDGYPEEGWFPWLKKELEKRNFEVNVPKMPNANNPEINEWVSKLQEVVGEINENIYFVGHSIGCQTILRYLEKLPNNVKIGGAVFVAPWFTLMNLASDEEWKIAKPWLETEIALEKVKKHCDKFIVIFSDNDNWVPLDNQKIFKEKLNAKIIVEHEKGHFSGSDNITKLPSILNSVLEVAK